MYAINLKKLFEVNLEIIIFYLDILFYNTQTTLVKRSRLKLSIN